MMTQAFNSMELRKMTGLDKLSEKIKEYINLAEGIVNEEMDIEERYNALAGLYKHIDDENGGYYDDINNASSKEVDEYLGTHDLEIGKKEHGTGKALYNFVQHAKYAMSEGTIVSNIGGVSIIDYEMDWKPQGSVWPAQAMLFALMKTICWDGEYYWAQVKIRKGKVLPKFWEKKSLMEELKEIINQQGIEAGERNRQFVEQMNIHAAEVIQKNQGFFSIPVARVAPDGRLIVEYPTDNQEKQKNKHMIAKGRPTPDSIETGNEQYLYFKLYHYAEKIKDRLNMANEMQGLEKRETKYSSLNWMLNLILNDENAEYIRFFRSLPTEEFNLFWDSCCFEKEELESLDSFVDLILAEKERSEEDDTYTSWLRHKVDGHYHAEMVLFVLVTKLENELKKIYSLLVSANHRPTEPIASLTNYPIIPQETGNIDTFTSKYNGNQLLKIYENLSKDYLTCKPDVWLYVWGVRVHPVEKKVIKKPTQQELPIWSVKRGRKTAFAEMIRALMHPECGKHWEKAKEWFIYSDETKPDPDQLKSQHLHGDFNKLFLQLVTVH